LERRKLCQQTKKLMECSLGVFPWVLRVGPIAAVADISVAAHAHRVSAAAHVHVHAYQAAAPVLEFMDLKTPWIGNFRRPY